MIETAPRIDDTGMTGNAFSARHVHAGASPAIRVYIAVLAFMVSAVPMSWSAEITDYLILKDIGLFRLSTPKELIPGVAPIGGPRVINGAGIVGPAYHFEDHIDMSYEVRYMGAINSPSPKVQVTQHAGAESDKWLLHEVERGFRRGEYEEDMTSSRFRNIDGNNIFYSGLGGGTYRWVSNAVMVNIQYTDLYKQKPEPLEVVKAYLAKHPSTIPDMTIDNAHNEKWIKDEMERRLWLCDKWFMQLQLEKAELKDVLGESVKHMEEFLDYREKYYGVSGEEEKDLLRGYLGQQNGTEIKNRLENLKQWWTENKAGTINLP